MAPIIKRVASLDRLVTLFESDNAWFVDGVNGSSSNPGDVPGRSVAKPSEAIAKAAMFGVIYIAPMQYATYATISNRYYIDNVTVPIGKAGVQFIGAGPGGTHYMTVEMKTAAATSHVFDVYAPGVQFANMRLTGTSHTAGGDYSIIRAMGDGSANKSNGGLGIKDVTFSNAKIGGAVRIDNPWNCLIEDSIFHNCASGIHTSSSVSSTNGMWVKRCQFEGQPAVRDSDVWMVGGSANCFGGLIHECTFQGTVPALSGSGASIGRYIYIGDTWTTGAGGLISRCNFGFDADNSASLMDTDGTQCVVPATWAVVNCFGTFQTEGETGAVGGVT